jgi:hypothetical protein
MGILPAPASKLAGDPVRCAQNDKQEQTTAGPSRSKDALRMTTRTGNRRSFDCVWRKYAPNSAQDDGKNRQRRNMGILHSVQNDKQEQATAGSFDKLRMTTRTGNDEIQGFWLRQNDDKNRQRRNTEILATPE